MFRRIFAVFLVFCHLSVLAISCADERTAGSEPAVPVGAVVLGAVTDPGRFHNDILREFNHDNVLMTGMQMDRETFIARFLDATDSVFSKRGIAAKLDQTHVANIIDRFEAYRSFGLFDFQTSAPDRIRAIDYGVERGDIDAIEAERLHGVFRKIERVGFSVSGQGRVRRLISSQMKRLPARSENRIVHDVLDVAKHSYQFWTELVGETPAIVKTGGGPDLISPRWLQIIAADAIAAMLFASGGVAGVVAAAAVSMMFSMLIHAGD